MTDQTLFDSDSPVIDRSALESIVEIFGSDDPEAILDLIDTFLVESTKQTDEMRSALAAHDWSRLHRMAHSLKSSSATFGATRLSNISAVMESAAKRECVPDDCGSLLEQLIDAHSVACDILRTERARFAGDV